MPHTDFEVLLHLFLAATAFAQDPKPDSVVTGCDKQFSGIQDQIDDLYRWLAELKKVLNAKTAEPKPRSGLALGRLDKVTLWRFLEPE